jgi:hypothetical protein
MDLVHRNGDLVPVFESVVEISMTALPQGTVLHELACTAWDAALCAAMWITAFAAPEPL